MQNTWFKHKGIGFIYPFVFLIPLLFIHITHSHARSPFSPAIQVNTLAVTYYEIDQRVAFLKALRSIGDLEQKAREELIEDKLRLLSARAYGLDLTPEELDAEIEKFAERFGLEGTSLIEQLNNVGVAESSLREYIRANALWRDVIQERFAARTFITELDIDQALAFFSQQNDSRILLSEIVLSARTADELSASRRLANELLSQLKTESDFARAAALYSIAPSNLQGGRLDWLLLNALPPEYRPFLLTLRPGAISDPIEIGDTLVIFQVRNIQETTPKPPSVLSVDYVQVRALDAIDDATARALFTDIKHNTDTCEDFYGIQNRMQNIAIKRDFVPLSEIPNDIAAALQGLDEHESIVIKDNKNTLNLIMMCTRVTEFFEGTREEARRALLNRRLETYAESYMEELKAQAFITVYDQ